MIRVGLTGGIASGKSEVARRLAVLGAVVIDADVLAREVVARGTDGLAAVAAAFGPEVLTTDGELDRGRLGAIVFADPDARRRLEAIVHPLVRARAAELQAAAVAADPNAVVVHDIPLLVETGQADDFDVVVVVDAPDDVRLDRLVQTRGMAADEARARIGAQASRTERNAAADVVVDNSGDLGTLVEAVDDVWQGLTERDRA